MPNPYKKKSYIGKLGLFWPQVPFFGVISPLFPTSPHPLSPVIPVDLAYPPIHDKSKALVAALPTLERLNTLFEFNPFTGQLHFKLSGEPVADVVEVDGATYARSLLVHALQDTATSK